MSIKQSAAEFASRLGHTVVADFLASARAIEAYLGEAEGEVKAAVTGKRSSAKAAAGETAAAPTQPATAPATAPAPTPAPATVPAGEKTLTKDDVKGAFLKLIQKNARNEVERIQTELGAENLSSIKPEQYGEAISKANDALALL